MTEAKTEPQGPESWNIQSFKDLKTEDFGVEMESQPFIIPGVDQAVFRVSGGYLGKGIDTKPFAFTRPASISVEVELIEDIKSQRTFDYWRKNLGLLIHLKNQKTLYGLNNEANDIPNKIIFDGWSTVENFLEYVHSGHKALAPNTLIVNSDEIHNLRFDFFDARMMPQVKKNII